jgi:[calcium/calmodulin-dependent protein kinase] kinase
MTNYVPEYFAVKVYIKPYLKKQRSFIRSTSSSVDTSSQKRKNRGFLQHFTTALDDVYKEVEIMKRLDHPHIVKLYEIIDDPNSEKLYLIMPVADYGESIEWDPSFNPAIDFQQAVSQDNNVSPCAKWLAIKDS